MKMKLQPVAKPIRSFIHGDSVTTYWDSGDVTVQRSSDYFRSLSHACQNDDDGAQASEDYAGYAE